MNAARERVMFSRWPMSMRSTIMPPSTVNSGIGGRTRFIAGPSGRASKGRHSSTRPEVLASGSSLE